MFTLIFIFFFMKYIFNILKGRLESTLPSARTKARKPAGIDEKKNHSLFFIDIYNIKSQVT